MKDAIALENKTIDNFYKNENGSVYFYINYDYSYDHNHKKNSIYDDMIEDVEDIAENPKREIRNCHLCKEYSNGVHLEFDLYMYPIKKLHKSDQTFQNVF